MGNKERLENIMSALKEYGIRNEAELDAAIAKMTPLDIGCMVSKPRSNDQELGELANQK